MINKYTNYIIVIFISLFNVGFVNANEFIFDTSEILISDNGNIINSKKGTATSINDRIKIDAQKFIYNKKNSVLDASGNVVVNDLINNILIYSQNIIYNTTERKIISKTDSSINIDKNILVETNGFILLLNDNLIKLNKVKITDNKSNTTELDIAYINLITKKLIGNNVDINFNSKEGFSENNEPRLKGASLSINDEVSIISKGVFTTCKKNDDCPPWQFHAEKITHDKKKKMLYYDKAWLKIYDKPVFYFPKFFHPDPSVKRQSGFLMPKFADSTSVGTSLNVPYYHVISENRDFTLSPRVFFDQKVLIQSEYREINKNSDHNLDFSSLDGKNHFFSKSNKKLQLNSFENSEIYLDLEQTSNDTYLKTYKLKSPLIKNNNNLKSTLGLNLANDDFSFNSELQVYENLSKKESDRFEYVFPSYLLSKNINNNFYDKGDLSFNSSGFLKNYDTNVFEKNIINDLVFNSDYAYSKNGIQRDYAVLIKNANTKSQNSKKYKESGNHTIASLLQYNLSYPLKKDKINYKEILKPIASLRISPNKSKNNKNEDTRIDIDNIFSLNRISDSDTVEGGLSLTYGLEYFGMNKDDQNLITAKIASQTKIKEDKNLSASSGLGKKTSNIVGNLALKPSEMLSIEYDFSVDDNLTDTNFQSLTSSLKINNFVTSFEYLNENTYSENSYLTNETSYGLDESKKISFKTRKNKQTSATEYYNLMYQYRNDCLIASLEYNKDFYSIGDLRPEENIFFKLTIIPFGETSTPNILK
jgi:LPS-assembly protein